MKASSKTIPFYAVENPRLFDIEKRSVDRPRAALRHLDSALPQGRVLDLGAGDGWIAAALSRPGRLVVPVEPAEGMIDPRRPLPWVRGIAQELPFGSASFAAAYSTFAYFFPSIGHGDPGLEEAHRVVVRGGPIIMVDNAGDDDFTALSGRDIASDPSWWAARGFACQILESCCRFDTIEEAREYLTFCFGPQARDAACLELAYRIAVYTGQSKGPIPGGTKGTH